MIIYFYFLNIFNSVFTFHRFSLFLTMINVMCKNVFKPPIKFVIIRPQKCVLSLYSPSYHFQHV